MEGGGLADDEVTRDRRGVVSIMGGIVLEERRGRGDLTTCCVSFGGQVNLD